MLRFYCGGSLLLALLWGPTAKSTEHWTSFHNGGNASVTAADLPLRWSPHEGVAWRVELPGYGQSAPVIWRGCVFVTAVEGDLKETNIVLAFDAVTGDVLWTRRFPASVTVKNSYMVSRAAPTPLVDANGLYVLFESGDLYALSHQGQELWHHRLFDDGARAFHNSHGYGASPAQTDDAVLVLVDHRGPSYLAAIQKQSGELLWKTERSPRSSWTSPQVARLADGAQIIASSDGTVDGYDAATGRQLWSYSPVSGNAIPSVTVTGEFVFVGASVGRDDTNAGAAAASNFCLRITPRQEPGYALRWRAEKAVCDYASPLVHEDYVYYVNKVGVVYCLEAATGRQCFAQRIGSPCWAQPIGAGERIYFFGKNGSTTVIRKGPDFERLAVNALWDDAFPPQPKRSYDYEPQSDDDPRPRQPRPEYLDPIVYSVVTTDGAFFARLGTHLYCIGNPRLKSTSDSPAPAVDAR